jgi:hypothetical protein
MPELDRGELFVAVRRPDAEGNPAVHLDPVNTEELADHLLDVVVPSMAHATNGTVGAIREQLRRSLNAWRPPPADQD